MYYHTFHLGISVIILKTFYDFFCLCMAYKRLKDECLLKGLPYVPCSLPHRLAWECVPSKRPQRHTLGSFFVYSETYDDYLEIKQLKELIRRFYFLTDMDLKLVKWGIPLLLVISLFLLIRTNN